MNRIRIYDPPLCCSTGVCGVDVDQELVRVSADVDSLRQQGADIARYNLASEPSEFASDATVRGFLEIAGSAGLPLVSVGGVTVMTGGYPSRQQLESWAGLTSTDASQGLPMADTAEACCAGQDAATQAAPGSSTGCCS